MSNEREQMPDATNYVSLLLSEMTFKRLMNELKYVCFRTYDKLRSGRPEQKVASNGWSKYTMLSRTLENWNDFRHQHNQNRNIAKANQYLRLTVLIRGDEEAVGRQKC